MLSSAQTAYGQTVAYSIDSVVSFLRATHDDNLVVLMLGSTLAQLSKHMPSAGGYYTYVSRAIHPRAGFLVSWM